MSCAVQILLGLPCRCSARIPGGGVDHCVNSTEKKKAEEAKAKGCTKDTRD